ncbi:hypothetical protein MHU86_6015 [Fragilaria crotonensis]|nr:hypothetical protein MHU86_6015 [Fragilaria crotonensis]
MARYVCTIHMFTEEEPIKASYSLGRSKTTLTNHQSHWEHVFDPCSFPESDPEPTRNDNSTTLDSVSKFSTSSPIPDVVLEISDSVKRSVNGSNASLSYCAAVDTETQLLSFVPRFPPNPQQWACRAHNPTVSSETLTYLDVQHPVPIKLEDLPSSQADDVFLADHCYSCSNNDSTRETVNFILMPTQIRYQKLQTTLIPNQWTLWRMILTIMATLTEILVNLMRYQVQLYNNLSDYCLLCALPHRCDPPTPRRHSSPPFRMFQHFHHIPSRNLFFTEAMLMDTINGTIHLRDLPLCVRTSATISAFCINTLADPPELNIIRGLDKHFIHHILRHVIRDHMYIDELIPAPTSHF